MGPLAFPWGSTIYVDSPSVIYAVEEHPVFSPALRPLWLAADQGMVRIVTSELTLMEVLIRPIREADTDLMVEYRRVLAGPAVTTAEVDRAILERAAALRAAHQALRTPDAIHAATSLALLCTAFVTNDKGFRQLPGLPVYLVSDYVD